MKRLFPLVLLALCTLVTGCGQHSRTALFRESGAAAVCPVSSVPEGMPARDRLHGQVLSQPDRQGAVLADSHSAQRVCSSRPQRLIPAGGGRSGHAQGRFVPPYLSVSQIPVMATLVTALEQPPQPWAAPQEYYVFTLGRMLC